jgi:hypothetical protein
MAGFFCRFHPALTYFPYFILKLRHFGTRYVMDSCAKRYATTPPTVPDGRESVMIRPFSR